jgi:hypothetical protein
MNQLTRLAIGAVAGALVGFAIYTFIGCRTGTCPLTADPYTAMIVYGLFGAFIMGSR